MAEIASRRVTMKFDVFEVDGMMVTRLGYLDPAVAAEVAAGLAPEHPNLDVWEEKTEIIVTRRRVAAWRDGVPSDFTDPLLSDRGPPPSAPPNHPPTPIRLSGHIDTSRPVGSALRQDPKPE